MAEQSKTSASTLSAESSARDRLLDAAEYEFAVRGYRGASLRRITDRAGVAHGNIRHLFGGKHNLLGAVYQRIFEPLTDERIAALDGLLARNPEPSITEVFDASAEPVARFLTSEKAGLHGMFALHGLTEHDAFWPFVKETAERMGSRFAAAAARAMPDLPEDEAIFRWKTAQQFFNLQMQPTVQNVEAPGVRTDVEITRLRRFAVAILTDPLDGEAELAELPWSTL